MTKKSLSGILFVEHRWQDMNDREKKNYLSEAHLLHTSKVLKNELNRIKNKASQDIVRHTKVNEEIAWHRGTLFACEELERRLLKLEQINLTK